MNAAVKILSQVCMALVLMIGVSDLSHAEHVILCGGPALKKWEGLRVPAERHDNWWANFVRASTIRVSHIQQKDPKAKITWIVFKPGYVTRGKEDKKPYTRWIDDLAKKYKIKLVWVNTSEQAIKAINKAPRKKGEKVESFYYFGHSNCYAFMLDYGNDIMAISTQYIHINHFDKFDKNVFAKDAECWSYGCYTGEYMTYIWKKHFGIPLWGNTKSTQYGPVSSGRLPSGGGKWVH